MAAPHSDPADTASSRDRLLVALRTLAAETSLDGLTPSAVARRAGVHRVTFYRHWPDLDAAVSEAYTQELDQLSAADPDAVAAATDIAGLAALYAGTLTGALQRIRDEREVYRALFAQPAFLAQARPAIRSRAALMIDALRRVGVDVPGIRADGTDTGAAADFLTGASLAVLGGWAGDDAEDATERAELIIALMPAWWPRA